MRRVLMICPQYYPLIGGYERAAERLSAELVHQGWTVEVITEHRNSEWPRFEVVNGVAIRRLFTLHRRRLHVVTSVVSHAIYLLWCGRSFDVWHVHQYGIHAALAVALGRLVKRPVVIKLTSSSYMGLANTLGSGPCSKLLAVLHRRCAAIVALTRETAAEAVAFGIPKERIRILGNGLDERVFRPSNDLSRKQMKRKLGLDSDYVAIFVGRLSEEKDISRLIRAWSIARPRMRGDWQLVLVGDGVLRQALEKEVRSLNCSGNVRFVGQQANVADWLAASRIFVQSSKGEGLSNTMLEAMATGLPLIVTRVSGADELVNEGRSGIVVPVGDTTAIAEALVELALSEQMRVEMGARGRQIIEARFSITKVATAHAMLYAELTLGSPVH